MRDWDRREFVALGATLLGACAQVPLPAVAPAAEAAPAPSIELPAEPLREFRGAWVASVSNIDWPSKPGLPAEAQRAEALAMLDRARSIGLNAIILQVRPAGDALYRSTLEPWSEFLTGEQGRAPDGHYDPLAFWIEQAHKRGLELHAWFNPYRARHSSAKSPLSATHLGKRRPELVKAYGDMLWMDPGEPAAAAHTLAVVADVVRRYDIDGVHIDDYFYPYPVPVPGSPPAAPGRDTVDVPFPDDPSWARYQLGGGLLSRDDWRRHNVDQLVEAMHRTIHEIKPWVRFGISPFGIGKPERRPAPITGFSQYDKLYADVERWLAMGWLDYLVPQLYWPIDREGQQFPVLLDYWLTENLLPQRHMWPGLFTSQVRRADEALGPRAWPAKEIVDQIAVQRSRAASTGHVHFSMVALMQDRDGIATLLRQAYAQTALTPTTPWLGTARPAKPRVHAVAGKLRIDPNGDAPARWALWRRTGGVGGTWRLAVLPAHERIIEPMGADVLVLAAVDRLGNLSERVFIRP